jgi:hypothetical protein
VRIEPVLGDYRGLRRLFLEASMEETLMIFTAIFQRWRVEYFEVPRVGLRGMTTKNPNPEMISDADGRSPMSKERSFLK